MYYVRAVEQTAERNRCGWISQEQYGHVKQVGAITLINARVSRKAIVRNARHQSAERQLAVITQLCNR